VQKLYGDNFIDDGDEDEDEEDIKGFMFLKVGKCISERPRKQHAKDWIININNIISYQFISI